MSLNMSRNAKAISESRRQFLRFGTAGAMTSSTFLSTMLHLRLASSTLAAASVPTTGYKALVCVFLHGAIDGFQVLTPYGDSANDPDYVDYVNSRTNLALKRTDYDAVDTRYGNLLPIVDSATGRRFGVHPRFARLRDLYNQGRATFVANVGSLVEPIADATVFADPFIRKPLGIFSHSDMQRHWQTAVPTSRRQVEGWGGRMSDLLTDPANTNNLNVYTAIATNGSNMWQSGTRITPYSIRGQSNQNIGGAIILDGYAEPSSAEFNSLPIYDKAASQLQFDLASQTYVDLLQKSIATARIGARDSSDLFQGSIAAVSLPTQISPGVPVHPFETSGLGSQLASVARCIKARTAIGQSRQIFMVQIGQWDHHSNLLNGQDSQIPSIDSGLKSFHDFLAAENLLDSVCTFTISDFGRTISSNGQGSDHAWGNNMIVMGGPLNTGSVAGGNRIWGSYPSLKIGPSNPLDTSSRGTYIPTLSTDAYHAELCRWFGIPNDQNLELVLPNIRNFYASSASSNPVGFLDIS
jgi:uncharacterized protein (DUF1501 family)